MTSPPKYWHQVTAMDLEDDSFSDYLEWIILKSLERPYQAARAECPDDIEGVLTKMIRGLLADLSAEFPEKAASVAAAEQSIITGVVKRIQARSKN